MKTKTLCRAAALCAAAFLTTRAHAAIVFNENFNYSNGNLATVSSGAWKPSSFQFADAKVASGVAQMFWGTDALRPMDSALLTTIGTTASFSFDINIPSVPSNRDFFDSDIIFEPNTRPSTTSTENLGSAFGLKFHRVQGSTSVAVSTLEGLGTSSYTLTSRGSVATDLTHTITGTLSRNASNTAFALSVDGVAFATGTFVMNDARGINTVNLWAQGDDVTGKAMTLDNIVVSDSVPEPASISALVIGAIALRRRRAAW